MEMPALNQTPPPSLLRARWTNKDDLLLCRAWLNIIKDVVGNDQTGKCFWRRVEEFYDKYRDQDKQAKRNRQALQNRWGRLSYAVSKFVGCYEQIQRESGLNGVDKKNKAMEIYYEIEKENFVYLHAWEVLRNEEKWLNQEGKIVNANFTGDRGSKRVVNVNFIGGKGSKRTKNTESDKYTSSSSNTFSQASEDPCVGVPTPCPMGRDSSKGKGKMKHSPTQSPKSDSLDEQVEKLLNLEIEKVNLMKQYMKQQKEKEKNRLMLQLMQLDTSTMNEIQKNLYEKQMKIFLDENE